MASGGSNSAGNRGEGMARRAEWRAHLPSTNRLLREQISKNPLPGFSGGGAGRLGVFAAAFAGCLLAATVAAPPSVAAYDLMIIAANDFEEAVQPLVDHKNRTGVSTFLFTIRGLIALYPTKPDGSDFYDAAERIKYAIHDQYATFGIRYVLLMGDCGEVAVRYTRGYLDDYTPDDTYPTAEMIWEPSDLYYADVVDSEGHFESWDRDGNNLFGEIYRNGVNWDEIDYHPDVRVARVPASSVDEVTRYVTKVIRYEYRTGGQPWFNTMTFSAHDLEGWAPVATMETIATELAPQGFSFHRFYHNGLYGPLPTPEPPPPPPTGPTPTPPPTPEPTAPLPPSDGDPLPVNLAPAIENGTGFFFHSGHGNPLTWNGSSGVPVFDSGDVAALSNPDRLPIIFADSCETGRFCPYVPYDNYRTKAGATQTEVDRHDIGDWICPEPAVLQWIEYDRDVLAERFLVESENGAIAYWGCGNTGERQSLVLAREFFTAYTPGITLGEMWRLAVEGYYTAYRLNKYSSSYNGNNGDTWIFHQPERFILFGDPSLRVGGVPGLPDDTTPPHTTHNVTRSWYGNEFTLVLTATDAGCGVKETHYRVGPGRWMQGETLDFSIAGGTSDLFTINYYSEDFINPNEAPHSVTVRLDAIRPDTVAIGLDGPTSAEAGVDFTGPVTVTLGSADHESGLDMIQYRLREWNSYYGGFWSYHSSDYSTDPSPLVFTINQAGRYRLEAWATDNAGNESVESVEEFSAIWVEDDWFHDLANILSGQKELALIKSLEMPFPVAEVRFFARLRGDDAWTLLFADAEPQDGWGGIWETAKFLDGIYDTEAVAYEQPPAPATASVEPRSAPPGMKIFPLSSYALINYRPPSEYSFTLDESPRIAQRHEDVQHVIAFENLDNDSLNNLEMRVDLGTGGHYDLKSVQVLDGGTMDANGVILWTLKSLATKQTWTARFTGAAGSHVASGTEVLAQALLRCDEIPVIVSDDKKSAIPTGDPTRFVIQQNGGTIAGRVCDAELRQALAATTVTLQGSVRTLTDEDGVYVFRHLNAGTYTVAAEQLPWFGAAQATGDVDGTSITLDLYLERMDLAPPRVVLAKPFEESVALDETSILGTATDGPMGSGVNRVEAALERLADHRFWDGATWGTDPHWFEAGGAEAWNVSLGSPSYEDNAVYSLRIRATDNEGNASIAEFHSRPPTPTGLTFSRIAPAVVGVPPPGSLVFTWTPIPGCQYLFEVSRVPRLEPAFLSEYLDGNSFVFTGALTPGTYYWRVFARVGTIYGDPSDYKAFYYSGNGAPMTGFGIH